MTLTQVDKRRIQQEEEYRFKIRRDIESQRMKPARWGARVYAFAQTSLGIWVLSTLVVGVITWGYALLQSNLQQVKSRQQLAQHADTEAHSRVQQWLNMCRVRAIRSAYANSRFQEWYFVVLRQPEKNPQYTHCIYSVYSEFQDRALLSVLTQLRDNVPVAEQTDIDKAIAWVGDWNPDVWEYRTFDQNVQFVRDHLWLNRWGREQAPLQPYTGDRSDVKKIYQHVLGRDIDEHSYDYWNEHPTSFKEVIRALAHSQEFACKYILARSASCPGSPAHRSLHEALIEVYPHVLGRDFNPEAWKTASDWARSRGWDFLIDQLIDSAEFAQNIAWRWGLSGATVPPRNQVITPSPK